MTRRERVIMVIALQLARDHAYDGWHEQHVLDTNSGDLRDDAPSEEEVQGLIDRLELINELEQEA